MKQYNEFSKEKEPDYKEMMMASELIPIMDVKDNPIAQGTLIGYKAFKDEDRITAAYPVYSVHGDRIIFILYYRQEDGKPCLDDTSFHSDNLYINKEPVIVPVHAVQVPTNFGTELKSLFGG